MLVDIETIKACIEKLPSVEAEVGNSYKVPVLSLGIALEFYKYEYTDGTVKWHLDLD